MKQGLIPASTFVKQPSRKFCKKHQKLEEKLSNKPVASKRKGPSGWLKKQIKERERKESEKRKGEEAWAKWLDANGHGENENIKPAQMLAVWGEAPPIESPGGDTLTNSDMGESSSGDDEDHMAEEICPEEW